MSARLSTPACMMALIMFMGCIGCDKARVRALDASEEPETTAYVARVTITNKGLSEAIRNTLKDDALVLDAPALQQSPALQIGPMAQSLEISDITVTSEQGRFSVSLSLDNALLLVPVRRGAFDQVKVCRWRVQVQQLEVVLNVGLDAAAPRRLTSLGEPEVTFVEPRADVLGACDQQELEPTQEQIIAYAKHAIGLSARAIGEVSPLESFGVILDGIELTRQSNFETRRGRLSIAGALTSNDPAQLDAQGFSANLAYGVRLDSAAACAPPVDITSVTFPAPRTQLDQAQLERFNADLGFALSWRWIQRLLHVLTRAGFLCEGIQNLGIDPTSGISTPNVLLSEVNIDASVLGERVWLSMAPGSLPRLAPKPNDDTLELGLEDFTLELYSEVFGALTRVAKVVVSANMNTRLNARPSTLDLNIESITIERVQWESAWTTAPPSQTQVSLWTRRLLLLAFDGAISLPLPFREDAPVRLVQTQLRNEDLVFYMRSTQGVQ